MSKEKRLLNIKIQILQSLDLKKHPELVKELDTCLAFVPTELQSDNPEDPDVLEIASKIKEWHVNKDVSPNDNYLTVNIL